MVKLSRFNIVPVTLPHVALGDSFKTYTMRDGLAGNFVTSLGWANDGAVWVGTTTGATRIEASRWTIFTHVHGLGHDWITSIAISRDQRVWFGTQSGGLSVFDGAKFTTFDISNSAIPSNFVTSVAVEAEGTVWVGTLSSGVARFNPAAARWTPFRLPNNSVTSLAVDANGSLWAGTDGGGAFRFDGSAWQHADVPGSGRVKKLENVTGARLEIITDDGRFAFDGNAWAKVDDPPVLQETARSLLLSPDQIAAFGSDARGRVYLATPRGLIVSTAGPAGPLKPPEPLPVVLVHGWTVSEKDDIQDSEFRFLKQYAQEDGIPVFYAQGISPRNTLFQNAERLRDDIAEVRHTTGSNKVNLISFSMGGLNTRAYLESSLYLNDVNRVIILGTPEAGVDIWMPILAEQIIQKPDEPSAVELSPEYSVLFNQTHAPRAGVPYDLLIGDARKQPRLEFIADLPTNDGLISAASALSLAGANVRDTVDSDLHAYDPTAVPFQLTSYLYPRDTYDRYLRNALHDPSNSPIGSEVTPSAPNPLQEQLVSGERNHTPVVTAPLAAGETVTRTVVLDGNTHARFLAYFPGGDVDFLLEGPDGQMYNSAASSILEQASGKTQNGAIALKADIASFEGYSIANALPGQWQLVLARKDKGAVPLNVTTYVDLDATQRLNARVSRDNIARGESVTITASLYRRAPDAKMSARIAAPSANPGEAFSFIELPLVDDGNGNYSSAFTPSRGGYYLVFVTAGGSGISRGAEFLFGVNPGGAKFGPSSKVNIQRGSSGQITGLALDVDVQAQRAGRFAIGATLQTPDGVTVARLLTPADLSRGANAVRVGFEVSDLIAPAPYSLDLTLVDASWAAIQVDRAENVATIQP